MNYYRKWKDIVLDDDLNPFERAQLAVWEYPLSSKFIKAISNLNQYGILKNLSEGLQRVSDPNQKFALIAEHASFRYIVMTDPECQFMEISKQYFKKPYAFGLTKNSPLTAKFNEV